MSNLKRKTLKEFLAMLLTLAMIFTGVHVPFVYADGVQAEQEELQEYGGVISSKVDGVPKIITGTTSGSAVTAYTFDATTIDATGIEDKASIAEGTTFSDGYFKVIGSVTQRISSDKSKTTSVEVGKNLSGAIQFTVTGTADVTIVMSSTGGSNKSMVGLVSTENETLLDNKEGLTEVQGTTKTTLTYSNLTAGTYKVVSPKSEEYNRGARVYKIEIQEFVSVQTTDYMFDATTIDATGIEDKTSIAEGTTFSDGYFKVIGSVIQRISSDKSKTTSVEVGKNLSGAIQFTVTGTADVTVVMSSTGGSNKSMVGLISTENEALLDNKEGLTEVQGTTKTTLTYSNLTAGTYKVVSPKSEEYNRGARVYSITVTETTGGERPARADWSTVAEPSLGVPSINKDTIIVPYTMLIGYDGADKIEVTMKDKNGNTIDTASVAKEGESGEVTFKPSSSGTYIFSIEAIREGEVNKLGAETVQAEFLLPLTIPYVSSATNKGSGSVEIEWDAVAEAEGYVVTVNGEEYGKTDQLSFVVTGLTVGTTYTFGVCAVRGTEQTEAGKIEATVTQEAQRKWAFSAYGSGVDTKNNGYEGSVNDGSVTVYSESGKGKIVPGSTDGLAFYYTVMDPEAENFTLTATVSVDQWTLSNGQEGFGLMVSDAIGKNGDNNVFWNNSFMAISSKIEYNFDGENVTTDTSASKISMKLGLGTIAKTGVTAEEVAVLKETGKFPTGSMPAAFVTESSTLETSCGPKGGGTYNIVGNFTGAEPTGTQEETLTTFRLSIQRNNTGYILSYLDKDGNVIYKKLYYDLERTALTSIDKEHIYLGFFASRNARITVTDVELTTIHPDDDAPAEEREVEEIYPNFVIESASVANRTDYDMVYYGNADGTLKITNSNGQTVADQMVKANTKYHFAVNLKMGNNRFTVTMTPDPDYVPGEFQKLTSYDTVTFTHNVSYNGRTANPLYVTPNGKASGTGMKNSPVDIYTAVQTASPGTVIVLAGGTYHLSKTVKVERGISGTESQKIYMIADPDAEERPVFDFGGNCAGMVLAGDYWYFYGFDVTNSADAQKGIQVSGNYNTLDRICTYKNGNTGLQISRYLGTDEFEEWPSYNQILNCTSYLNADKGYEDADGFAAKLTVGNGNVFDGCIAAYNADDGWDLFAKVQSGSIGSVTIKNSLAFKNGYLIDENGNEFSAGNGNGFKMGGDSMSGYHVLEDSIAFANKAKGIDSNSCPDIQVYRSTSFDNVSYNVAMYTNTAVNTDYLADGILSYKKSNTVAEQFKLLGTQDNNKVYGTSNYYFDGTASVNTNGEQVTDAWFVDLDTEKAITNITRNTDGVIQMNGYLELTASAPSQVGARLTGTTSLDAAALLAGITPIGPENNSSSTSSDNDNDDDDDDYNNKSDYSYIGKSSLSGIEQSKISSEAASIFGSSYYIASATKVESGICITSKSGDVIFSKNNGSLAINEWQKVGTDWYYFDADRKAAAGWKQLGGKWYYLDDSSKKMVTGWKQTATGNWYYLDRVNGDMKTGWQFINQVWYYLDQINGDMKSDWQWVNNKWYYLDPINGNMRTGWQLIRGKWYYLNPINGDCLLNTVTPDGYIVDENGAWVQ